MEMRRNSILAWLGSVSFSIIEAFTLALAPLIALQSARHYRGGGVAIKVPHYRPDNYGAFTVHVIHRAAFLGESPIVLEKGKGSKRAGDEDERKEERGEEREEKKEGKEERADAWYRIQRERKREREREREGGRDQEDDLDSDGPEPLATVGQLSSPRFASFFEPPLYTREKEKILPLRLLSSSFVTGPLGINRAPSSSPSATPIRVGTGAAMIGRDARASASSSGI